VAKSPKKHLGKYTPGAKLRKKKRREITGNKSRMNMTRSFFKNQKVREKEEKH
jgi:hypothetical protein